MKTILGVLLINLSILSSAFCQDVSVTEGCQQAYDDIISLKFNKAREVLEWERENDPQNLFVPYLENYIDFLTVFISEDETQFKWLEDNKSKRIDLIKKLSDTSRFRNYMLGNIHLQWAVARLKFNEYFTAAFEINKAYRLLEKNAEEFPGFVPNKVSLGVLHVMIGMVPKKYHWILDLISMEGSVTQGRQELEFVIEQSNTNPVYAYLLDETLFYMGFIDLNIKPDEDRLEFLLSELEKYRKDNLLLSYLTVNMLMRTGQNEDAIKVLEECDSIPDTFPFYFLRYLEGECHLRKLDPESAAAAYQFFIDNFKGKNFLTDAKRKLAWIELLNSDPDGYEVKLTDVRLNANEDVDIDKEALKEAESGIVPNAELIKARLLFDGGYYPSADSVLLALDENTLTPIESIEREYRLARIAHKSGNKETAIEHYQETVVMGSTFKKYFAGNSALQLGEIYESESEMERAAFYYKLCLDLDFDEYENSIHSKAKAGLERVNEQTD